MAAILAVLAAILAVHSGIWFYLCARIQREAEAALIRAREEGWKVQFAGAHWAGWPVSATVVFSDVIAAGTPETFPGLVWRAAAVRVGIGLTAPTTLAASIEGAQSLDITGLPHVPFQAEHASFAAPLQGDAPPHARIAGLTAKIGSGTLRVGTALFRFGESAVAAELADVAFPGVSPDIQSLKGEGSLTRPIPPGRSASDRVRAWRNAGGLIELRDLAANWGSLEGGGSATIGLDEQLQPKGVATVQATGLAALLNELAKDGALTPSAARAAQAVIAILSAGSPGGTVNLPVTLESGVLTVARFPLVRLPPIAWE